MSTDQDDTPKISPEDEEQYKKLVELTENFNNMSLAHSIAVDENFVVTQDESDLYSKVKKIFHDAFWNVLEEQLNETPPNYTQAISLLQELRTNLNAIVSSRNVDLRTRIDSFLDVEHIQGQLDEETFDLEEYADFVLQTMASQCAPARDEAVAGLHSFKDRPSLLFRNIFEVMELLKLDMLNFSIKKMRPFIIQNSVDYERRMFSNFIGKTDGLPYTKNWILAATQRMSTESPSNILNNAYVNLLCACVHENYFFPETLVLDTNRIMQISESVVKLCLISSFLSLFRVYLGKTEREEKIKMCYESLIAKFSQLHYGDIIKHVDDNVKVLMEIFSPLVSPECSCDELAKLLKDEFGGKRRVFTLLYERVVKYFLSALKEEEAEIPSGIGIGGDLLMLLANRFRKVMLYNRIVHVHLYDDIIRQCKEMIH